MIAIIFKATVSKILTVAQMYSKKSTQPQTPNVSNVKKNTKTVQKPQQANLDKKNDTMNDFKMKEEQLMSFIRQHLLLAGYTRTCDVLKNEKPSLRAKNQVASGRGEGREGILQQFDRGLREEFFKAVAKYLQGTDENVRRFEFQLQIYFCIYGIHPHLGKKQASIDQKSSDAFKRFLETRGSEFSQTSEFLSFFALPYMPRAHENKSIAHVFTKEWLGKLRNRLSDFLNVHLKGSNGFVSSRKLSHLQEIFYSSFGGETKENCSPALELQQLKKENTQLRIIIENIQKRFDQFSTSTQNNLIESNYKWFSFAREIFLLARSHMKEEKKAHLERYSSFFSKNISDHIEANEISIFDKHSYNEDLSVTPDMATNPRQRFQQQKRPEAFQNVQIDLARIKAVLLQADSRENECCLILRALRCRFTRAGHSLRRREIIIEYVRTDICGATEEGSPLQDKLLKASGQRVKILYLKLMEMVTTDFIGLQYLTKSPKLVANLVEIFTHEKEDSGSRRPVLGILQRISYSRQPRLQMIRLGIIPTIFEIFKNQGPDLSTYTTQFLVALCMNLSLKKESYPFFEANREQLISIVAEQMSSPSEQIRNYTNGTIYLLLLSKSILAEARRQKLDELVSQLLESKQDDMCIQQYDYILRRLRGEEDALGQGQDSDEEEEEEEAEVEELDDDEQGPLSDSDDDDEQGDFQIANGEQFLLKNYALLGPQAVREQILTRSVLDETSKRLNNMTTSINRSRRLDNIFAAKVNATVLENEPELEYILNRKQ